uniref:Inhibitor of growth protein n=1 Tax=Leptobrachium leishanense TaxID=445787 RepID=A0A8C5WFI1_9ANUR
MRAETAGEGGGGQQQQHVTTGGAGASSEWTPPPARHSPLPPRSAGSFAGCSGSMLGQQQQNALSSPGSSVSGGGMPVEESQLMAFVEDYLECVESLPHEIQRNVSLLREIDTKYREALKEADEVYERYKDESDPGQKKRLLQHLQRALIIMQELGDDKIQLVTQFCDMSETKIKQMEIQSKDLFEHEEIEKSVEKPKADMNSVERSTRRPRRQRNSESRDLCHLVNGLDEGEDLTPKEKKTKSSKKRKRSKAKQEREVSPVPFAIDPNEPTYCLCNQVSFGEMIGCDNEECTIEWFHFSCVGLTYKPKGKWYCPDCRGDNEKTMNKNIDKTKRDRRSR